MSPKVAAKIYFISFFILMIFLACQNNFVLAQQDPVEIEMRSKAMQYFQRGLAAEQAGDLNTAVEMLRKSVTTYPKVKEVHYKLAQCCAQNGNSDEAMREFRTALNIDNNFVNCRNDYGLFLLRNRDDVNGAMTEWKKCTQIDPKYPFPYYNMGLVHHDKGDLEAAIENFETVTRLKPDFSEGFRELGLCIFERAQAGDLSTAVQALEMSARLAPENPKVHYHLGFIYATKGNLDDAESEFRRALQCDNRLAAAHWELARIRYLRGDLDRCLTEINEAFKINPSYTSEKEYPNLVVAPMKTYVAQCFEYKGKLSQAIDAYLDLAHIRGNDALFTEHIDDLKKRIKQIIKERKKTPLTYDPEEVDALVSKSIEQYEDGDLDGAKASSERALQLNPLSVEALMCLSNVQESQGDLNNALVSNQKAIASCPAYDGLYYNAAYLLEKMSLPTDAGMMYEKFRERAGKYPYDPQHIIQLQQDMIRQQRIEENRKSRGY